MLFNRKINLQHMGENGIFIEIGNEINKRINTMVKMLSDEIEKLKGDYGIKEIIPAYTTILIIIDPLNTDRKKLEEKILEVYGNIIEREIVEEEIRNIIEIPTLYDYDVGLDLEEISKITKLKPEEIIKIHSEQVYRVYMVGFIPGFPYMGEVPEKIAVPRLENPRIKVPAGSVGIAGTQTGIYPFESPGGWRIIGRTPIKLFDPNRDPPTIFKIGDYVKFKPISREVYDEILRKEPPKTSLSIEGEPVLKVDVAGPGVSIQDLGREGYRKYGVPVSGAMDKESFITSNILVGNNIDCACIEIFQSNFEATVLQDIIISICGANVEGEIDGEEIETWRAIPVRKGSKIKINRIIDGLISYISIAGGINEPIILGSRSHYLTAGIGRELTKNAIITTSKNMFNEIIETCPARRINWKREMKNEFRILLGPHLQYFTEEMIKDFTNTKFTVTSNINRMGYRLEKDIEAKIKGVGRLISCGTLPGAIQIPGDGNPIVLMADAQTTGGYAVIGKIIEPDLNIFSQCEPKTKIKFKEATLEEAIEALKELHDRYKKILNELEKNGLEFKKNYKHVIVKFERKIYDCWIKKG
ncbi:MAG: 5-oxoprolinase subunit PxpB [Candidatus Methanomethylicia archaeon]